MPQKKKKITEFVKDSFVRAEHIHRAQGNMACSGPMKILADVDETEPELARFVGSAAFTIAAEIMLDTDISRSMAQHLRDRIVGLAMSVYQAHHLAVYDLYKDLIEGTMAGQINQEPEPPAPPSALDGEDVV